MAADTSENEAPFPWHLGVYDAHCHPTDTMSLTSLIPSMKTRILTIMATRSQDQDLVAQIAETRGIKSSNPEKWEREECVVPCFGWHPWFSHQMYEEETREEGEGKEPGKALIGEEKVEHYKTVFKKTEPTEEERSIFDALPDPMPFSQFLDQTRAFLEKYPFALVGEIGLDRGIRIPDPREPAKGEEGMTPGSREGRKLANLKPDPQHQKRIFQAQMRLAAEMGRAVSIHGVQAHGMLFESVQELFKGHEKKVLSKREKKKAAQEQNANHEQEHEVEDGSETTPPKAQPYPPRICLHSYSGDFSTLSRYLQPSVPIEVFASFSTAVNLSDVVEEDTPKAFIDLIRNIPDHLLLVESDLHTAGDDMDRRMEDITRRICKIKGWGLEQGIERLGTNWMRFVFDGDGEEAGQ
jgi:Tat protein secretion system quality control protein TatD with DNase activity